ncbi:hypothetical protein HYDPIDRAFT_96187 [Hydnomerulius pinastri MD-312]|uniref:Uncharacterized protein n=1 Tax=Hydnomerulius pinastri MD-312 TaxID=994086 RepID=A0A0C9VU27_9AGAM|nr:hypothetical protein HYDPIDRAFT_96187 [Hydnomerulius pinastri MD-312]
MVSIMHLLIFLLAPVAVLACEGDCIIDITNQYLIQYSPVVINTFQTMANLIDAKIIPPSSRRQDSISYFTPALHAYNKTAYAGLEHAIFPSYFHGKCQDANGINPPGCPNPDCPKVCGTPGSMVHFYPKLCSIVFEQTRSLLTNLTSPGSKTYKQMEAMVLADASKGKRRALSKVSRFAKLQARGTTNAKTTFASIMKSFPQTMEDTCGGPSLSQCSWEQPMKTFILQYP